VVWLCVACLGLLPLSQLAAQEAKLRKTLKAHAFGVYSVAFSPDGKTLASGNHDETIQLWDVKIGVVLRTLRGHTSWVRAVSFSPDGKTLASGSRDRTIKLWDVKTGKELATLKGHPEGVNAVAFSPDGRW
jgi:WD40 repeat protein